MNRRGIHLRPAGAIFNEIRRYPGKVTVVKDGASPCVIDTQLSLVGLCLMQYTQVTIHVEGEDEEKFCDLLSELFSKHYDFT